MALYSTYALLNMDKTKAERQNRSFRDIIASSFGPMQTAMLTFKGPRQLGSLVTLLFIICLGISPRVSFFKMCFLCLLYDCCWPWKHRAGRAFAGMPKEGDRQKVFPL
jgi:hypothetical protein